MIVSHWYVEMEGLDEIEAALGMTKDKSKMVLRTAINNTAKQAEKLMTKETKSRYKYKSGKVADIRKANEIKKAKASNMVATITAKGPANELLDFVVKPNTYFPGGRGAPKWVKAKGRRNSKLSNVAKFPSATGDKYKGFIVKFKSGHLAMVERVPGKPMKGKPHKEALESLYSIATPKMEEVAYKAEVEPDMYDLLMKNIQTQIQRYLK